MINYFYQINFFSFFMKFYFQSFFIILNQIFINLLIFLFTYQLFNQFHFNIAFLKLFQIFNLYYQNLLYFYVFF